MKDEIKAVENASAVVKEKDFMSARTIVGYITRPNGSPISGAEIWISRADETGGEADIKPIARTDSRGYFQINFAQRGANFAEAGGKLSISIGARRGSRKNSAARVAENGFQVNGYLINENAAPDARR